MKRLVIVGGIVVVTVFILYQFIFADRRSRLKVDTTKMDAYNFADGEPRADGSQIAELNILAQQASFNESTRNAPPQTSPVLSQKITRRKLIKNGSIDFEVTDVVATRKLMTALVKDFDGYIASDKEENYSGGPQVEQIIRIPSDNVDGFVARIEPLAKKMRSKTISTHDVTDEYIDLTARLTTKRDLEANYREILRKATTVSEMLEVEQELEKVRGDIESMDGRMRYIDDQVSHSTLKITYYQLILSPQYSQTIGEKVIASFENGWFNLTEFVIALLGAWPLLIFGPPTLWLSVRWARKRLYFTQPPAA